MATKEVMLDQVNVVIDDVRFRSITIPDGYVPYSFNAHVDNHLLLSGDKLRNGMIVLPAEKTFRENPERLEVKDGRSPSPYDRARVQETARWSIVTDLRQDINIIHFTSLYADGTMIPRSYNKSIKWMVLKEFESTIFCPACGEYHDPDAKAPEGSLQAFLNDIVDDLFGSLFGEDKNDTETNQEEPSAFDRFVTSAFNQFVTYSSQDAEATQRLFEAQKRFLEDVEPKKPKPVWVEQISVLDIEEGDWLPMGGDLYRVLGVQINAFDDVILTVKSLNKDPEQRASSLILSKTILVNVKRRVQQ